MDKRIGIFSTLPIEIIYAAGMQPVDVNNLFVGHENPAYLVGLADKAGVPRTVCAWTRGLFGATMHERLETVVAVLQGDCSNNTGLAWCLEQVGVRVIPFRYPLANQKREAALVREMENLAAELGIRLKEVEPIFKAFRPIRSKLALLDRRMAEGTISAAKARLLLLTSTDMAGDPVEYLRTVSSALNEPQVAGGSGRLRVAVYGVPTVFTDLYETLDASADVVLCETERDFAMIPEACTLTEQYLRYCYPYGAAKRLERFVALAQERGVEAIVRYQQSFCHHNLEGPVVDAALQRWPNLVVEGDLPGPLSARDRLRLDAFLRREPAAQTATSEGVTTAPRTRVGLDLGSRFAKVMVRQGEQTHRLWVGTVEFFRQFTSPHQDGPALDLPAILAAAGAESDPCPLVVATGYGRHRVRFSNATVVPEIQAHALGAAAQVKHPSFLLVDLGGQDTKVLWIRDGRLCSFVMNDKCAAGGGRYVENMARMLEVPLEQVLPHWENPLELSTTCATFGESEVVGLVAEGVAQERIFSGILQSVASRTLQLVARLAAPGHLPLVVAGGLAASSGLVTLLQQRWGGPVEPLVEPQWNGAAGCLILSASPGQPNPLYSHAS